LKSFGSFHLQAVILCGCDLREFGFTFFINLGIYLICKVQTFIFMQFEINPESMLQQIQAVILLKNAVTFEQTHMALPAVNDKSWYHGRRVTMVISCQNTTIKPVR
jgi:hypothetical protein